MKSKVTDIKTAIDVVKSGDTVLVGGFGIPGAPMNLVYELMKRKEVQGLSVVSEGSLTYGVEWDHGLYRGVADGIITELQISFFGSKKLAPYLESGQLKLTLIPQGTLAERLHAGGAGLGGVLTPTGVGTIAEEGKQVLEIDGKKYILEKPLRGNVALIKVEKADEFGNGICAYTGQSFNTPMATAADIVIMECHELVKTGELDPNHIHIPGVFVDYVVHCPEVVF